MSAFRVCINAECCLFISLVIVRAAHRWCFAIFEGGVHVSMGHEGRGKEGGLLARGARGGGGFRLWFGGCKLLWHCQLIGLP